MTYVCENVIVDDFAIRTGHDLMTFLFEQVNFDDLSNQKHCP